MGVFDRFKQVLTRTTTSDRWSSPGRNSRALPSWSSPMAMASGGKPAHSRQAAVSLTTWFAVLPIRLRSEPSNTGWRMKKAILRIRRVENLATVVGEEATSISSGEGTPESFLGGADAGLISRKGLAGSLVPG